MQEPLRILLVEDQPVDAELLRHELQRGGLQFCSQRVDTREAFETALEDFKPDLILSDFSMPNFDGLTALDLAHAKLPHIPFIFISGTIGEERAIEALRRGATDYVLKERPKRVVSAIGRALDEARKQSDLRDSQQALLSSEKRFRSFMQHLPARASIIDAHGCYTFVNDTWEREAGKSAADVVGHPYSEILPQERAAGLKPFLDQVAATGKPVSRIHRIDSSADARWWCSNYFPMFDAEGNLTLIGTVAIDITEQKKQEEQLNYLSYFDPLTGLPNRTLFQERLAQCLAAAAEEGSGITLVVWNINRFGLFNESLGRQAADELLRELGARFSESWPEPAHVARLNSDCFAGIVRGKDVSGIVNLLEKFVQEALGPAVALAGQELTVSMTAGVALYPADGEDCDTLFRNAEAALKQAKTSSGRYAFYQSAMNAAVTETLKLEGKLRRAVAHEEFTLHYQPKIELATGKIAGVEALIRWNDPDSGLVSPARFIPLLEETGLIVEVGRWAIRRALSDWRAWHDEGLPAPRVAVNVSAIQLSQEGFMDMLRSEVERCGIAQHGLDLEITESLLMQDIEGNIAKLHAVQEMAVNIAIDDFGTGYSSLRYLAQLPVNALKIDRSFVMTMADEANGMAIASTVISLGHALGMKIIAEGVETEEQRHLLRLLKCELAQGYLFHKPLPVERLREVLRAD